VFSNASMDTLDYTGPAVNAGSKGLMLGLGDPWRTLPRGFSGNLPPGVSSAVAFCAGVLLVGGPDHAADPRFAERLPGLFPDWPLVIAVDDPVTTASSDTRFLWTVFTRFEPAADLSAGNTRIERHHIVYSGAIAIDARFKSAYPAELRCDDATRATVDRRWSEYFPNGKIAMGDSDAGHLDQA